MKLSSIQIFILIYYSILCYHRLSWLCHFVHQL